MPYKNPEDRLAHERKYRAENRDKTNQYQKEWRRKNPRRRKSILLKHRFGITIDEYESILKSQDSLCPICLRPPVVPVVDHDHKTGEIRGILCREHNSAIGYLQDSSSRVELAAQYLKNHGG